MGHKTPRICHWGNISFFPPFWGIVRTLFMIAKAHGEGHVYDPLALGRFHQMIYKYGALLIVNFNTVLEFITNNNNNNVPT
ncbi:hypothetical protein C2G38_25222 [Gigaspora rosea]|uniref:Uncharacterized protein n=1 Tax=Gigaspora rosea TaxID=44941 RepID=A0A397URL5_9GLOM|nr:hypothetical protein C2G38_25222 [Gigaspora rosea]